jgi:hypothetical protein
VVAPDQVVGEPGWVVDCVEEFLDGFVVPGLDQFVEFLSCCTEPGSSHQVGHQLYVFGCHRLPPDQIELLVVVVEYRVWIDAHPLIQQGCIGTTEVVVEAHVAFDLLTWIE